MSKVENENVQTWLELMKGFEQARAHYAESARQALLGSAEAVRVLQQLAADPRAQEYGGAPAVNLLDVLRKGLALWADKMPGLLEARNFDAARREALTTVKEVLLAEVARVHEKGSAEDGDRVKLEALEAILRVVDMELERRESDSPRANPMRRVVIE